MNEFEDYLLSNFVFYMLSPFGRVWLNLDNFDLLPSTFGEL